MYNIDRRKKIAHNCIETFAIFEKSLKLPTLGSKNLS